MKTSFNKKSHGFTLVEMTICTALIGILAGIALPTYQSTMNKVRRSDALVALMDVHLAQSRFRANNAVYGNLSDIGTRATSPSGHYAIDVASATPAGFVVLATASGVQRADSNCGVMKLTVDGSNVAYASGRDTSAGNDSAANKRCWML
jgi:type IV pilus assembly protein PilE